MSGRVSLIGGVATTTVVVATVVVGLTLLGSPADERARRVDQRRVTDLMALASAIDEHWATRGDVPTRLDSLAADPGVREHLRDPETDEPYELTGVSGDLFQLCATFAGESASDRFTSGERRWTHPPGRHCFELRARRPAH